MGSVPAAKTRCWKSQVGEQAFPVLAVLSSLEGSQRHTRRFSGCMCSSAGFKVLLLED